MNRLLPRSGEIPASWRNRLNLILGTDDWYQAFYKPEETMGLFNDQEPRLIKAGVEAVEKYFIARLKSVFPAVASKPKVLMNSTGCPLYIFCFAASSPNRRAQEIALKIANHILKSD